MPIIVICSKCATKLSAPDSGAGKYVRCPQPQCGTFVPVPAFVPAEVVEVIEASLQPPKPNPTNAVANEDEDDQPRKKAPTSEEDRDDRQRSKRSRDDDGDDEDEHPKRRRTRRDDEDDDDNIPRPRKMRKKSRVALGVGMIVAIVLGGLLVVGGIGFGVYVVVGDMRESMRKKAPPLNGWKEFTYRSDKFKAYFPNEPWVGSINFNVKQLLDGLGVDANYPEVVTSYQSTFGPIHVNVVVARFKSRLSSKERAQAFTMIHKDKSFGESRRVRWLGVSADEYINGGQVTRIAVIGSTLFSAEIGKTAGGRATPEEEAGFFDNIQLLD